MLCCSSGPLIVTFKPKAKFKIRSVALAHVMGWGSALRVSHNKSNCLSYAPFCKIIRVKNQFCLGLK
jgi:hypothetical protein